MTTVNECIPITIFPLGIACQTTNPSGPTASDGMISLIVTGGTPPYSVSWENGNSTFSIDHLSVGSYPVTVVDYYGDFTATTACVLTATTTTTSTSTTTTTPQPLYDFCMQLTYYNPKSKVTFSENIHFNPNGLVNGYQSWISDDTNYTIVWDTANNRWTLSGVTVTVINNNPAYPPLTGWIVLGVDGHATVIEGLCPEDAGLTANVSSNATRCLNCDGNITLSAAGGFPPYQYSINGGVTWGSNPLFISLCPNTYYYPKVKDSNGNIATPTPSSIYFPGISPTPYNFDATTLVQTTASGPTVETKVYTTNFTVSPTLPPGVTISFDVTNSNQFLRRVAPNSFTDNTTYSFTKNGNPIAFASQTSSNTVLANDCGIYDAYSDIDQTNWTSITIGAGDVITLIVTSTKTKNLGVNCYTCCASSITNSVLVANRRLGLSCSCCELTFTQSTLVGNSGGIAL